MIHALVNLVGFQIGWLACVCGAASGWPWVGPIVVAVLLVTHLIRMNVARKELQFICTVALLGWLIDTMQGALGTLSFSGNPFPDWISPPWMVALWINFALTLHVSLAWLLGRYWLGSMLGALGGPLAYWTGSHTEAIHLGDNLPMSLLILALLWGGIVPVLILLAQRTHSNA